MRFLLIFSLMFWITACSSDGEKMNERKQELEAYRAAIEVNAAPRDGEELAESECNAKWVYVYDNTSGDNNERYDAGKQAYKQCMDNKGY